MVICCRKKHVAMTYENLYKSLEKYIPLKNKDKELLKNYFTYREVPKNFKIIDYNEVAQEWYFLNKGCVRFYYIKDNGDQVTGFFFTENMFFTSVESFLSGKPGIQVFETLESCELLVLNKKHIDELYDVFPKMNIFTRKLLEERFVNAQNVVASFILHSPEERYEKLFQRNPQILNRVPQHTLATYLGITPVSLSRIRKRILG